MSVQVKRADLVKLTVAQIREDAERERIAAEGAVVDAHAAFTAAQRLLVLDHESVLLSSLCGRMGVPIDRITVDVHLDMTDDVIEAQPLTVAVTVRDHEPYATRIQLRMSVPAHGPTLRAWIEAEKTARAARARSLKAKDLNADARLEMAEKLLDETVEGAAVLAALKVYARAVRERVEAALPGPGS